ncbi:MAG TPA: PilZ domain-containing protein [Terriglobales bacterium]|nr:PilZ domain-containing protein [Terriglobales bacterium]
MKAAIALNGMFLCRDVELLGMMNRILDDLAIEIVLCMDEGHAMKVISERVLDCVIVEWNSQATALMKELRRSELNQECFAIALVNTAEEMNSAFNSGVAIAMQKPGTSEHALRCMRAAYGSMIRQRRSAFRALVKIPVEARKGSLSFSGVIVDVSHTGLCLHTDTAVNVRDSLQIDFTLPGRNAVIRTTGRVVWVKHSRAGVKFSSMPQEDFHVLKTHLDGIQKELGVCNVIAPAEPQPPLSDLLDGLAGL